MPLRPCLRTRRADVFRARQRVLLFTRNTIRFAICSAGIAHARTGGILSERRGTGGRSAKLLNTESVSRWRVVRSFIDIFQYRARLYSRLLGVPTTTNLRRQPARIVPAIEASAIRYRPENWWRRRGLRYRHRYDIHPRTQRILTRNVGLPALY